jgi:predicted permease
LPPNNARVRADVDAELEFHIHGRIEELVSQGMSRDEAEREARRRFGDYTRIENEVEALDRHANRKRSLGDYVESLLMDVKYAARSLRRQPMFATVVIVTLTLGMGATAAIFHAVDRVILHPLPYPDANRVVYLGMKIAHGNGVGADALTGLRYQFWHDESHIFDGVATYRTFDAVAGNPSDGTPVSGLRATGDLFHVVGTTPMLGRTFAPAELSTGDSHVAILSYGMWQREFAGDRGALGRTVRLNDSLYTVVGVMPESFEFVSSSTNPDVIVPYVLSSDEVQNDDGANYTTIARLRDGLSQQQIDEDLAMTFARFSATHFSKEYSEDRGVTLISHQRLFAGDDLVSQLWLMLGATSFVFLLACVNVGNIVFARALNRRREFAVRAALGAGRGRIIRQIAIEVLIFGAVSAALSVAVGLMTLRGLVALAHGALLRDTQLHLDPRVVVYTSLAALAATLIVGIAVALATTRIDLAKGLSAGTRSGELGARHGKVREALVSLEAAIAMVLLAGAGLLIASFTNVLHVDAGFRREGIFTASVGRIPRGYDSSATILRFEDQVLARLQATPGILSAAATARLPLKRGLNIPTTVEGHNDRTEGPTEWRGISPTFFHTMDIHLVAGRNFSDADAASAPPVTIISQSYARDFFPGEDPIGQRILIGAYKGKTGPHSDRPRTIVGVVADLKDGTLEQTRVRHTVWVPQAQTTGSFATVPAFVVRANDAGVAANALRGAIADADARMRSVDVEAMSDIVSLSLASRRFSMILMTTFAGLALVLTCVGIYGVASYSVSQRIQEIGLRMALGAEPRTVVALVVREGIRPAIIGLVLGLGIALAISKVLANMLFGVTSHDPTSLAAVAFVLIAVAFLATFIPARRASRVDPVTALRVD